MSPQASDELRAEWPGGDEQASTYLEGQGYRDCYFYWVLPHPNHVPTERELSALQYLMDEWDWGGIISESECREMLNKL